MSSETPFVHLELRLPMDRLGRGWPLPPGLTIRHAEAPRDLAPIAELFNVAFGRSGEDAVTAERVARFAYHPGVSPLGVFLAFAGDQAVGLSVARLGLRTAAQAERRGAVELLAVRPGYRRRGLARALLGAALNWLESQRVTRVEASTDRPAVVGLLAQCGFVEVTAPAIQGTPGG